MYIEYEKGEKFAKRGADTSNELKGFDDAGYILPDDVVVVDIDNLTHDQIETLIKTFEIKTQTVKTDRGVHLYFKKPKAFKAFNKPCALGWTFEYKVKTNTKSITVKRNGVERPMTSVGVFAELPDFLVPSKKIKGELEGLGDGDGRNTAMFIHKRNINVADEAKVLTYVNNHVFGEPLPDSELQVIIRTEVENAQSEESDLADKLIREYKIVSYANDLYFYDGKQKGYITGDDLLVRLVYQYADGKLTRYVDEVIKQIRYKCELIPTDTVFPIKFENGVLFDGEFTFCNHTDFTPYVIEHSYLPDCKPVPAVDNYLKQLCDSDEVYQEYVLEILGHTLITDPEVKRMLGKFFIFVGDGGNGKGTLLEVIKSILNRSMVSTVSVKQMEDERYLYSLKGKLANLGDDLDNEAINNDQMKKLKNISTCDTIEFRKMRENSVSMTATCSLIFTSNHAMKSFEKGEAYKRRVVWLPMFTKPKKKDPKFISRLTNKEALTYWVKRVIEAHILLCQRQSFLECEIVDNYTRDYHEKNDNIIEYLKEHDAEYFLNRKPVDCYTEYAMWAEDAGLDPARKGRFTETVSNSLKIEVRNAHNPEKGRAERVYQYKKGHAARKSNSDLMFEALEQEIVPDVEANYDAQLINDLNELGFE